ncbi:MAG: hypothetical protein QOC56_856 [Alphaproteobacteria bacterium]|jgi:hypothetical protein|nr:hypothetical protein [Alphaproteobacteria bacterium]
MRPATLAETFERIIAGDESDAALAEFLDTFYLAATPERRIACLRQEPPLTGDPRLDALAGAVAEYLSRQYKLPTIPAWAFEPVRYLDRAWHTTSSDSDGMREYLTYASPAEFRSRNIFTEERPLRRARSGLTQL